MSHIKHYTIGELAARTGTTPRTIRYYTAEGILPPPDTRGKYALYSDAHALRLEVIAKLKEAYLPLSEIRARLQPLTYEQLERLQSELEVTSAGATGAQAQDETHIESAAEYISHVLGQSIATQQRLAEASQSYAPPQLQVSPPQPSMAPVSREPLQHTPSAGQAPTRSGFLGRLLPRQRPNAPTYDDSEIWQRIELAPGIELHIQESRVAAMQEQVEHLLHMARRLFRDTGGGHTE